MTGLDALDRIRKIDEFIESLQTAHAHFTNWNEAFGEGNPDASRLKQIIEEFKEEKNGLLDRLSEIDI